MNLEPDDVERAQRILEGACPGCGSRPIAMGFGRLYCVVHSERCAARGLKPSKEFVTFVNRVFNEH